MKNKNRIKKLRSQIPGILVLLVLMLTVLLPSLIVGKAPRYWAGNPNFDIESYKQEALDNYLKIGVE